MPSAFIPSTLRFPAMPLARQLLHQRCVHPGPLVLGTAPVMIPPPTMDRDRTVSRRSEPSSRAALIGEQPNPWDLRGSFYPLSDDSSTRCHLITMPDFRLCSTRVSRSQAPFCHCTLRMISSHSEGTFGRLRYSLGGDRPSQTAHLSLSIARITAHC